MLKLRRLWRFLLAAACLAGAATVAAAEVQFPPGLRVGIEPPATMQPSPRFPGFEDADRKAAITLLDLHAAAFPQIEAAIFADTQPGLSDVKRESFPFASGIGFLMTAKTAQNGTTVHKWFLIATAVAGPVPDLATMVSVEVPESALDVYTDAAVRKALATVTFRRPPLDEQLKLLPFEIGDMAGFRAMQAIPGGVILVEGPADTIGTQPFMIIGVGRSNPVEATDRGRMARDLLRTTPLRELTTRSGEAVRIGGLPGYEIRATAKAADGSALAVIQWIRFGGSGYMRIIGVSRADAWDKLFPRFRTVRDSIASK